MEQALWEVAIPLSALHVVPGEVPEGVATKMIFCKDKQTVSAVTLTLVGGAIVGDVNWFIVVYRIKVDVPRGL